MLEVNETESYLLRMLADAGIDLNKPSVSDVLQVFKSFSRINVNCSDDALLFQSGVYNFTGRELFYLDFVRQFTINDEEGEYDHMEHLHCEFAYELDAILKKLETNLWSYDCDSFNDFFAKVEGLQEFQVPIAKYVPLKLNVEQEKV
jgi:hypothetical protein